MNNYIFEGTEDDVDALLYNMEQMDLEGSDTTVYYNDDEVKYVINNYYDGDDIDYAYRIRRFHRPYFYDPFYWDSWYYDPYFYGGYSSWYSPYSSWGYGYNWYSPYYSWGWGYSPFYSPYYAWGNPIMADIMADTTEVTSVDITVDIIITTTAAGMPIRIITTTAKEDLPEQML